MASFNRVILLGNLTKDPEVRYTPSGDAVADLRMAISRRFKGRDGEQREDTCFVGVTVWRRQAETCAEYLRKGSQVLVEGNLKYDEWEKDGQKHSRLSVTAQRVQFMGSPRSAEFRDGPQGGAPQQRAPAPQEEAHPALREEAPASREEAPAGADMPSQNQSGDDDNLPF